MKFQILIPQYQETEEVIKPLLDSIEVQQNVDLKKDVGVIICNDGSDIILSDEFFNQGIAIPKLLPLSTLALPLPNEYIKEFIPNFG